MDGGNTLIVNRMLKLLFFFVIVFSLIFCVTWQNVRMYLLQREVEELSKKRAALQKALYLDNVELSALESRGRIERVALDELHMVPMSYRDIRLIVYE